MTETIDKIKRLVFSGGGARGVVYSGAYAALEETGVFQDVEDIAGSSAGAITAALLAVGLSPEKFQHTLKQTDFSQLLGKTSKGAFITKDGEPLYDFIRNNTNTPIITFLQTQQNLAHECKDILAKLTNPTPKYSVTFGDLHTLYTHYPKQFKNLTVTAVKKEDGSLTYFNYKTAPDVEIALACKASSALPLILEPVKINGIEYIDGGISDNIPVEAFKKPAQKTDTEILVFAFVEGDPTQKNKTWRQRIWTFLFCSQGIWDALYGSRAHELNPDNNPPPLFQPQWWEVIWRNYLLKWFSSLTTDYDLTDKRDAGFQRIRRDYPLRTIGLGVDDLLATDFDRATRMARFMSVRGYLDTMDMILNHDLQQVDSEKTCDQVANDFYSEVVRNFICIYEAMLYAREKNPSHDAFFNEISSDKSSILSKYYLIRDTAQSGLTSDQTFALTYAVEYRKDELTYESLLNQIKAQCRKNNSLWCDLFSSTKNESVIRLDEQTLVTHRLEKKSSNNESPSIR